METEIKYKNMIENSFLEYLLFYVNVIVLCIVLPEMYPRKNFSITIKLHHWQNVCRICEGTTGKRNTTENLY